MDLARHRALTVVAEEVEFEQFFQLYRALMLRPVLQLLHELGLKILKGLRFGL